MKTVANITEIFSSLQGEGPYTGEPTTFVRFAGCSLACRWCDTESSQAIPVCYRVENPPRSKQFISYPNPISPEKLNEHLAFFSDPTIAVTGGEPLEQVDFLAVWLATAKSEKKILLETNGIFTSALAKIVQHIDIVSMDIKLPSSANNKPYWQEHLTFLSKSLQSGKDTYVKLILTSDTTDKDMQEAIKLIAGINKFTPVVLQPAENTDRFSLKIGEEQLQSFARLCGLWLPNVSIMRQMHKEAGLL